MLFKQLPFRQQRSNNINGATRVYFRGGTHNINQRFSTAFRLYNSSTLVPIKDVSTDVIIRYRIKINNKLLYIRNQQYNTVSSCFMSRKCEI